jgi:hypothetical protein
MIRHQDQGPGRTPAEADTSPTLPLDGATAPDPGTETTVPLEAAEAPARAEPAGGYMANEREDTGVDEHTSVDLARLAWLMTVGACLIAVAILVVEGYYGYAAVTFAVAASAALNLT